MTILKGVNYHLGLSFMGSKGSSNLVARGHNVGDFVLIDRPLLTVQVSSLMHLILIICVASYT